MSRVLSIVILSFAVTPLLPAQASKTEDTYEDGVEPSRIPQSFRTRIFRRFDEGVSVPDVLILRNGVKIEAYFLEAYDEYFIFFEKESDFTWVRDSINQNAVQTVLREQYLPEDPSRTRKIRRARKQPVLKQSVVAGTYQGWQDRYTRWSVAFQSEVNKPLNFSEDSTEYGRFVLESEHRMSGGGYSNKTRATGQYYLYAPNTVNNTEWVLSLVEVAYSEADTAGKETRLQTMSLIDDLLIVEFINSQDRFRLHWSNLSSRALAVLPQVEFQRSGVHRRPTTKIRRDTPSSSPRVQLIRAPKPSAQWLSAQVRPSVATDKDRSQRHHRLPQRVRGWKRPPRRLWR